MTTLNACTSSSSSVRCGTTQGSILGLSIYVIYVNDVFSLLECDSNMYLYADDMLIMLFKLRNFTITLMEITFVIMNLDSKLLLPR